MCSHCEGIAGTTALHYTHHTVAARELYGTQLKHTDIYKAQEGLLTSEGHIASHTYNCLFCPLSVDGEKKVGQEGSNLDERHPPIAIDIHLACHIEKLILIQLQSKVT